MAARDFTRIRELLETNALGRRVRSFEVHGINSLKTVHPPPAALADQRVVSIAVEEPCVEIVCDSIRVRVDLARTGTIEVMPSDAAETRSSLTGHLSLEDQTAIVFREPARTKRITFTLTYR